MTPSAMSRDSTIDTASRHMATIMAIRSSGRPRHQEPSLFGGGVRSRVCGRWAHGFKASRSRPTPSEDAQRKMYGQSRFGTDATRLAASRNCSSDPLSRAHTSFDSSRSSGAASQTSTPPSDTRRLRWNSTSAVLRVLPDDEIDLVRRLEMDQIDKPARRNRPRDGILVAVEVRSKGRDDLLDARLVEFHDEVDIPRHPGLCVVAQGERPAHHVRYASQVQSRRHEAEDIEEIRHVGRSGPECTTAAAHRPFR